MKRCGLLMILALFSALLAGISAYAWEPSTIRDIASLPVQEGGRVKPLDTVARFRLLAMNGSRSCKTLDGKKISAAEWLLDALFRSDVAAQYPSFRIETSEVVQAVGIPAHMKKRDRYSYQELFEGRERLMELAREYFNIPNQNRTSLQSQIANLAQNFIEFERLIHFMEFATAHFSIPPDSELSARLDGRTELTLGEVLQNIAVIRDAIRTQSDEHSGELHALITQLDEIRGRCDALALFPPSSPENIEWQTPADVITAAFRDGNASAVQIELMRQFEELANAAEHPGMFAERMSELHAAILQQTEARGEYGKVPLEIFFYKWRFFFFSQLFFVLSFVLIALSWTSPRNRVLRTLPVPPLLFALALLIAGIVLRGIIRGRPPMSTLYETFLFTTAICVIVALVIERANRQRIAMSAAALLGALGVFIANRYEVKEAVDTMPSLVAVLNTNFWLAAHVTTILIGYAGGLLTAAIAHVYLIGQTLRIKLSDHEFYESLGKTVYGVLCFAFVFSVIGTVLGGVWANESWGRFWGWDPKENGALMICLWQLAILHARRGGYIRNYGTAMASVAGGMIIAFSWWGVNLLGVGLHSYGFTRGVWASLLVFWLTETAVLILAAVFRPIMRSDRSVGSD